MTTTFFLAGLAAMVAGVAFIYWPAALIVGGVVTCLGAMAFEVNP